jgi:hypothetical protein
MTIDDDILLNQLAQGIVGIAEGERWFRARDSPAQLAALRQLSYFITNASPRKEDAESAVARSGLKFSYTPCVLLKSGEIRMQLTRILQLPENERERTFRLLVALLAVCDERRRRDKPLDLVNHWWHRDLSDPEVVDAIKAQRR